MLKQKHLLFSPTSSDCINNVHKKIFYTPFTVFQFILVLFLKEEIRNYWQTSAAKEPLQNWDHAKVEIMQSNKNKNITSNKDTLTF